MSKPVRNYFIMNLAFITVFLCFIIIASAQNNDTANTNDKESGKPTKILTPEEIRKKEDSLLLLFNKEQEVTIKKISEYPFHKKLGTRLKKEEKKTYEEYIESVNQYLEQQGRKQKVLLTKDIKQKLTEGELIPIKDSICVGGYKKGFLSRKQTCRKYEYHFYLKDSKGNLEKLW